jgi:hypothetical protein|tara:strand:- start:759 stop:863 length:105 start_codon:yes stop_codon:yes gene_type:complete
MNMTSTMKSEGAEAVNTIDREVAAPKNPEETQNY